MTTARSGPRRPLRPPRTGAGLVVANLDADHQFARALGLGLEPPRPTKAARARAGVLGRLMAVLAGPDDRLIGFAGTGDDPALWPGQSMPLVENDRIEATLAATSFAVTMPDPPNMPILPWAETRDVAALRAAMLRAANGRPAPSHRPIGHPVVDALWALAPPDPDTVARLNHRRHALRMAESMGIERFGAALVRSTVEVSERLAPDGDSRRGAAEVGAASCVVKAACSSAGRDRVWVASDGTMGADDEARLERLFARHGEAVIEPWLDRTADFGVVGHVDADGQPTVVGLHRQRVDAHGRFKGIDVPLGMDVGDDRLEALLGLRVGEAEALRGVHRAVGLAIGALGYRGAYGIDAWHWRDAAGRTRLQPLGELNARLSMGFLGRVLADRAVAAVGPVRGAAAVDATGVVRVASAAR
ncbi:MAG: hypothetical protein ABI780_08555 [Ardenticatenales bacterium]